MKKLAMRHAFVGFLFAVAVIGVALIGLAFGHALRLGSLASMTQHPLFRVGTDCLSASVVCALLLLTASPR